MSTTPDICASCGKPSQSGSTGSLTQWVFLCKCDALAPKKSQRNTIRICLHCGNRIGAGRSGTFTQWIFRTDVCDCENPQPVEKSIRELSDGEFESSSVDLSSIVEIEVDKEKFPIERFAPIEILGSTFDSTVYLAIDKMLGTRVAIKSVALHRAEDIVRFQKEVKALASLSHQGIVKVLDFAEKAGTPYMVMEYIDGLTLREFLKLNTKLSADETSLVIKSLCQTLSYCHSKSVLHRDIKPENLLVCADTEPVEIKLVDFGLACTDDTMAKQGDTVAGTPAYMAPDAGKGKTYDSRSEIYSVGCVLFELLTGAPPYKADSPLRLMKMHADADIPKLSSRINEDDFDPRLEAIVTKCLAKEPDDRFQTMNQLYYKIEKLDQELNEEPEREVSEGNSANYKEDSAVIAPLEQPQTKKIDTFAPVMVLAIVSVIGIIVGIVFLSNQSKIEKKQNEALNNIEQDLEANFFNADEVIKFRTEEKNIQEEQETSTKLDDQYLEFLTKNAGSELEEVMLNGDQLVSTRLLSKFFEKSRDLRTVTFANQLCRPEYVNTVSRDKSLRVIRLIHPSPSVLKAIPKNLKRLGTVAINNTEVTVDHIKALKGISRLNHLRFNFADLDNGAISETAQLKILHYSFANCTFWLDDFASLAKKRRIKFIRLKNLTVLNPPIHESMKGKSSIPVEFTKTGKFILSSHEDPLSDEPESLIRVISQMRVNRLYLENMIFKKSTVLMLSKIKELKRIDFRRCVLELGAKYALMKAKPGVNIVESDTMSVEMEKYRKK